MKNDKHVCLSLLLSLLHRYNRMAIAVVRWSR